MSRDLSFIDGGIDQANEGIINLVKTADGSEIDVLVGWLDSISWSSYEAKQFWIVLYFLVLRFGTARHVATVQLVSSRMTNEDMPSQMSLWIGEFRTTVAQWLSYRFTLDRSDTFDDNVPIPKSKAKVMSHIAERIGNPKWRPSQELVTLVKAKRFGLACEEGLHVLAALLIHGDPKHLVELKGEAVSQPMIAQVLLAHGVDLIDVSQGKELLAGVFVDPDDDAARWVYSDWLMELGDPHGEFIRAQLSDGQPNPSLRLSKLYAGELRQYIRWTGAHLDYGAKPAHFHRGFVHACAVNALDGEGQNVYGWQSLQILDVLKKIPNISEYPLPSLRFLGCVDGKEIDTLLASPLASQIVGLGLRRVVKASRKSIWDKVAKLPKLRHLCFGHTAYEPGDPLDSHPLRKRVQLHHESGGAWLSCYDVTARLLGTKKRFKEKTG